MAIPVVALIALVPAFVAAQNPDRTMTIDNQCGSTAYIAPTSGSTGTCAAGCPESSSCDSASGNCFWDNATPSLGNWAVPAGQKSVITYPSNSGNITWSGNYAFGLDGTTLTEDAATCASQGCRSAGPYNQAEFTLSYTGVDWYDISNIAGVNVPMSITPDTIEDNGSNAYYCGDTGAVSPQKAGLGASTWKLEPPSAAYQWVSGGSAATCSSDSDCSSGESCGNVFANGAWSMVCGALSGYWTENGICGYGIDAGIIECTAEVDNGSAGTTNLGSMQGCGGTSGSCYAADADASCCGGAPWTPTLGDSIVAGTAAPVNSNPVWMQNILHTIHWVKAAAPNAYTFPYDDMSSTFTCENTGSGSVNSQAYTITLCPSGTSLSKRSEPVSAAPARRRLASRRL